MNIGEVETLSDLVEKMILSLCGEQKPDVVRRFMRFSLGLLSSTHGLEALCEDEVTVATSIKSKMSAHDAIQFDKLHNDLKDGPLKSRISVLIFLSNVGQMADQIKDRIFSFPEMRFGLCSPVACTSGQRSQSSCTQGQIFSVNAAEASIQGYQVRASKIYGEECASEDALVQDLIYSFQGIEGKMLKLDSNYGFQLDPTVNVNRSQRQSVLRLSELGYLHNVIRRGLERMSVSGAGRVADSFVAALHKELSEYYRFIAVMQEEVNRAQSQVGLCGITLSHLHLWACDPLETLKWLAGMVKACQGQKGGALASAVYEFSHHGDVSVKKLVKRILESVCDPLYNMLTRWIEDGELDDPHKEFFIETCADVAGERMWHEKYQVRVSMLPSFIGKAQARKILGTGKSINFLREVCKDFSPWEGRDTGMFKCDDDDEHSVQVLFDMDPDGRLQTMMDVAYKETSTRVVEILMKQYHLMDHLQGIKGYLLLGQGHFIQHLMHLLEPELAKPANSLYPHNISSILETAVRATSAKLDELDVQRRLDVRLLAPSENETGWDVFILDYNVDGPIGTILEPCRQTYQTLFFALWRAKRMESILSAIWKQQTTSAKMFRRMPEVLPIQNHIHLITSSMVHLVHQMQYYFLFEVIECSWDVFAKQLVQATSLDDIIAAHNNFVDCIRRGTLLDEKSQELMDHLRSVYGPILELENLEGNFLARATQEYEARQGTESSVELSGRTGKWGRTISSDADAAARQTAFLKYLNTLSIQLRLLSRTYQDRVKKFLLMLASAEDVSLQLLSVRLDFNEYYKSKDSRLVAPLTYQHRRQGDQAFLSSSSASQQNILNSKCEEKMVRPSLSKHNVRIDYLNELASRVGANDHTDHKAQDTRTNLKNSGLSKRTFRIFLEKQILSFAAIQFQQNVSEPDTPVTSYDEFHEDHFLLDSVQFKLLPLTDESFTVTADSPTTACRIETTTVATVVDLSCSDCPGRPKDDSEHSVDESSLTNLREPTTAGGSGKQINVDLAHSPPYLDSPDWFEGDETVSVQGSLLSGNVSQNSLLESKPALHLKSKRCLWRRLLFCCIN